MKKHYYFLYTFILLSILGLHTKETLLAESATKFFHKIILMDLYEDADGDGFGSNVIWMSGNTNPSSPYNLDSDDTNVRINPNAVEICNNQIDDNGNGIIDENALYLNFDGQDDIVNLGTSIGNFGTGDFTVELKLKTIDPQQFVIGKREKCGGVDFTFWNILIENGKFNIELRNNNTYTQLVGTTNLADDAWHHIALVRESGVVKVYVDGQEENSSTFALDLDNNTSTLIGNNVCSGFNYNSCLGDVDELRFWNVARSATEIFDLQNASLPATVPGLTAYFDFNNPAAEEGGDNMGVTTLTDRVSGTPVGTLTDFALTGTSSNWLTDRVPTVALCQDVNVILDANGMATLSTAAVNDGSYSCEPNANLTYELDRTTFDCNDATGEIIWKDVGTVGFSAGAASYQSMAFHNGTPYVAFQDTANSNKTTVMKLNGNTWENVGMAGFSVGTALYQSLAIDNGVPYVAYRDNIGGGKAILMKYNGTSWESVGGGSLSVGAANYTQLAFHNSEPYVAFQDGANGNNLTVLKYSGTTWESVGNPGFSVGNAQFISFAFNNNEPYVAFQDNVSGANFGATVMKYDGNNWVTVGSRGFSDSFATYLSLAFDNGEPYVAFSDFADNESQKTTVMKYNGSAWENVGPPRFSDGKTEQQQLAIHDGIPYVAYQNFVNDNADKISLMKYKSPNWESVGTNAISAGTAAYPSLVFHDGGPHIAFQDNANGGATTVRRFPSFILGTLTVKNHGIIASTCTTDITITTDQPLAMCPSVPPVVILDETGNGMLPADALAGGNSVDYCGMPVSESSPATPFSCEHIGTQMVMLTATHYINTTATEMCSVTVQEGPPTAVCQDVTVQLDANGMAPLSPEAVNNGSFDVCDPNAMLDYNLSRMSFSCSDIGLEPSENQVTLTASKGAGLESSCTANITVEDNISPVAICPTTPPVVMLDANGNGTLAENALAGGNSTDNCNLPINETSPESPFNCSDIGTQMVTLTATDGSNNTDTEMCAVTVEDNIMPQAICPTTAPVVMLDADGNGTLAENALAGGNSMDNCSAMITETSPEAMFNCSHIGTQMVTLTAMDDNSNTATEMCAVTIQESPPTAICQDVTVQLNENGMATLTPAEVSNSSFDDCSAVANLSYELSRTSFDCSDLDAESIWENVPPQDFRRVGLIIKVWPFSAASPMWLMVMEIMEIKRQ